MYTLLKGQVLAALRAGLPSFTTSLIIAELLYKFGSFTLGGCGVRSHVVDGRRPRSDGDTGRSPAAGLVARCRMSLVQPARRDDGMDRAVGGDSHGR
jgi:hypothetical protein